MPQGSIQEQGRTSNISINEPIKDVYEVMIDLFYEIK